MAIAWLTLLSVVISPESARAMPASAAAPLVTAFVEHGGVFALRSDGSTIRLTVGTNAVDPVLSPDRSRVAYFTANRHGGAVLNGVWVVGTRANRQILVAGLHGEVAGALTWSPNGNMLAYLHSRELVVWRGPEGASPIVTRLNRDTTLNSSPALAWSPDGRQIAVPLPPVSLQHPPGNLSVGIVDIPAASSRVVRVNFPQRLMGSQTTALGSHPTSDQIGWFGGNLLVATVINGAGNSLTGLWRVSKRGGLAHPIFGHAASLDLRHLIPALDSATHFLVAPGGNRLATDPGNRFWVTAPGGRSGRFLAPHEPVGCTLAQWRWLIGGQGVAYVTLCPVGGTANFRSTLSTMLLQSGHRRSVVTAVSSRMDALSLAPASRCIACG